MFLCLSKVYFLLIFCKYSKTSFLIALIAGDLTWGDGSVIHWEVSKFDDCGSTSSCAIIFFKGGMLLLSFLIFILKSSLVLSDNIPKLQNVIPSLSSVVASALSMRFFYSQSITHPRQFSCSNEIYPYPEMYAKVDVDSLMFGKDLPTTPVPCRFISSLGADAWDVALCLISI